MKNTRRRSKPVSKNDLRSEYQFDYSKGRPNRFASQMKAGTVAVVLEPDVAAVFPSSKSVNVLLRSVIRAVPKTVAPTIRRRKAG